MQLAGDFVARGLDQIDQALGPSDNVLGALSPEFGQDHANALVGGIERAERASHVILRVDRRYIEARQNFADAVQSLDGRLPGRAGPHGLRINAAECAEHIHNFPGERRRSGRTS